MSTEKKYTTLKEFYPYYLQEHEKGWTKVFHFIGTSVALFFIVKAIVTLAPINLLWALLAGYFFAWISHMLIEKNRPATFTYPFLSFASDWIMFFELLTGKRKFFS